MLRFFRKIRYRHRLRADLESELALHQELAAAAGNPIRLENSLLIRERAIDPWRFNFIENIWRDLLYALRGFKRSPVFLLVATTSLALGIGANTAVFSVMDVVLLRLLPVQQPEALEQLTLVDAKTASVTLSYPIFQGLLQGNSAFQQMFARAEAPVSLLAAGRADRGIVETVSGNYFSTLGVRVYLGRLLSPSDDGAPMGHPVAVLSSNAWHGRFLSDPNVINTTILINNHPFTVVGVAPPGFFGVEAGTTPDIWVPAMMQPAVFGPSGRESFHDMDWRCWSVFGRRSPGISQAQAQAAVDVAFRRMRDENPASTSTHFPAGSIRLVSAAKGLSRLRNTFKNPILVLMAVVTIVLLIACANIANLLIARSAAHRQETALRIALGAPRIRLIQQSITENLLLSAVGGLLGIGVAFEGIRLLLRFLPRDRMPITLSVPIDARVLGFAFATSLFAGLFFGLVPALRSASVEVSQSLNRNALVSIISRRLELRKALVASQVALSILLVTGAGLFVESLRKASKAEIGLQTENALTATVNPAQIGYTQPQIGGFYHQLQMRLEQLPGVVRAGMSEHALLTGGYEEFPISVPGRPMDSPSLSVLVNKVGGDFFDTTGIAILRGSNFGPQIGPDTPLSAIINEAAAAYLFGSTDPIGRKVNLAPRLPQDLEIIGIARDSKYRSVLEEVPRILYLSFQQETSPTRERTLYLRTQGDPRRLTTSLEAAIHGLDAALPLYDVKTLAVQKDESLLTERLVATLSGFFAALALILAAIGLYGVVAGSAYARTREIGIRMSLGSTRTAVIWLVLREALALVVVGVVAGVPSCLWLSRFVQSQLFGVRASNPLVLSAACAVLAGVAALAAVVPAWRAAHVNPVVALRCD